MTLFSDPEFDLQEEIEDKFDEDCESDGDVDRELHGDSDLHGGTELVGFTDLVGFTELDTDSTEDPETLIRELETLNRESAELNSKSETRDEEATAGPLLVPRADESQAPEWSVGQLRGVAVRAMAVLVMLGTVGFVFGASRGETHVARAEFVYTLDESVPDSFLREDRRLLTQVVTFQSDAVLTPVSQEFDLSVDELRARIDVETLDLSEVLRLDVSDGDSERAIALNQAVLNQYLEVITDASPAGDSTADLTQRRADVAADLAAADGARLELVEAQQRDVTLEVRQASIQRQIDLRNEQLNRIQGSLDDALIGGLITRSTLLNEEFDATLVLITDLETDLVDVGSERAALAAETTAEPALLREIERLETVLNTIDDELSQRELAPLVASPIRELSDPVLLVESARAAGIQGLAIGLMLGLPLAALVAYRSRRRQLWID